MRAYTNFARVYDIFMDNIPYKEWSKYIVKLLKKYGIENGIVAELGCGTGNITNELYKAGYDMIGIDNSQDMLEIAIEKKQEDSNILYLLQDMREFELFGTVSAVISICDSINYIMNEEDLLKVFKLVNNYLEKDGIFIFDLNTEYKYENILADNTIAENRDIGSFIWENNFYKKEKINEYDLTLYIKKENNIYERYEEIHYQKAYSIDIIKNLIKKAGMELIAIYDAFTENEAKYNSERVYIVVKESYQEEKYYM